ncbi:ATP-binding protein [Skermania piniformis]|uniref:ATP-binding protein n=1 Tax=Skermania pinensis TaxID=39122 RepID=UPI00082E0499|nr:ATP-binding protein [Skermania piniformis]
MPPVPAQVPKPDRLVRRSGGRIVAGVAGGVADQLGVDPFQVRVAFVLLALLGGAGFVAYGLLWVFAPSGSDTTAADPAERRRAAGLAMLGVGMVGGLTPWLLTGSVAQILFPLLVVALGAALVWREFDAGGPRSMLGMPGRPTRLTWVRIVGGATLIVVGLGVVVLARIDLNSLGPALLAVAAALIGAALLTIPLWLRMLRALNEERMARIRTDERDKIASHLHDSVLQTLALIQRQADRPSEVLRLARSQERELRTWLFGEPERTPAGSLATALRAIAGEVEDQYGIEVTPVIVGDVRIADGPDSAGLALEPFTALLGATRESLVNAAKHAEVDKVDLFAEAEPEQVEIYVRDRGVGFDVAAVSGDRHGLSRSIRDRVERRGGTVSIRSGSDRGTEVHLRMPRTVSALDRPVPEQAR